MKFKLAMTPTQIVTNLCVAASGTWLVAWLLNKMVAKPEREK